MTNQVDFSVDHGQLLVITSTLIFLSYYSKVFCIRYGMTSFSGDSTNYTQIKVHNKLSLTQWHDHQLLRIPSCISKAAMLQTWIGVCSIVSSAKLIMWAAGWYLNHVMVVSACVKKRERRRGTPTHSILWNALTLNVISSTDTKCFKEALYGASFGTH